MTSKRRLLSLERDLQLAEAAYTERLVLALKGCAGGWWGVFGANDSIGQENDGLIVPKSEHARELIERGNEIGELRCSLGYEPFALHQRYLEYRAKAADPNAPGEPRLAKQFLKEIDKEAAEAHSEMKKLYKDFSAWLNRRFDEFDPQGLMVDSNPGNEYSPEVGRIVPLLRNPMTAEELASSMRQIFADMFDDKSAGSDGNYFAIAQECLDEWHRRLAGLSSSRQ